MCACVEPEPVIAGGIDAAAKSGWAIVEARGDVLRLRGHGAVAIATAADVEGLVEEIASAGPALVGIERPFVKASERDGNAHTGLELAMLLGRFSQAFEARGFRTAAVLASSWQPSVLGVGRWSNRQQRKSAAVAWVRRTFGIEVGHDAADAIAIATWAVRRASNRPLSPEQKTPKQGAGAGQASLWGST